MRSRRSVCIGLFALLSGCGAGGGSGFRPLYAPETGGALMHAVRIAPAGRGELEFRLHEALSHAFGPPREGAPLLLTASQTSSKAGLAITQSDAVTRYNLTLTVTYRLTRGETELAKGQVVTIAAVNAVASQYATLVSERESLGRAADDAADKILKRLALEARPAWFAP